RTSDGAYLLKFVRTDVEVYIDGILLNPPPVANEPIRAAAPEPEIWSEDACLCIRLPEGLPTSPVRIFTAEGRLLDSFRSTPGLNRRQLPTGIYIVQVGKTARKVAVK
uniref:T9SS type A sorting domain-containing protein n=1 Tax=Parabacteroides goldsteinii TaxID=328812 RepID=UPI003AB3599F